MQAQPLPRTTYSLDSLDSTVTLETQFAKAIHSEHKAVMDARKLEPILAHIKNKLTGKEKLLDEARKAKEAAEKELIRVNLKIREIEDIERQRN